MLICSCYGLCKFPCKRTVVRERRAHPSRTRPMIPIPSPGPGAIKQSSSSTFQQAHKSSAVNQQDGMFRSHSGRHRPSQQSFVDGDRRRDSLSPSRYSAPPSAASNVIYLSQLPSLSCHSDLEQFARAGSSNQPVPLGRQGGGRASSHSHSRSHTYQQRSEQNQAVSRQMTNNDTMATGSPHPPPFQAKPVDIPPPYPGMGFPYTPCKSPNTPHGAADLTHSQLHGIRTSSRQHHNQVGGTESELTDIDTMTEGETNSIMSGRARHNVEIVTVPPAYSTQV